jgi:hypothetical protein
MNWKKFDETYKSTESINQYNAIHENLKEIILDDLIQEEEDKIQQMNKCKK